MANRDCVVANGQASDGLSTGSIQLLNVKQVAKALGCTTRTVRRWAAEGRMPPSLRIGRAVRWRRSDLIEWVAEGCPQSRGELD